MTSRLSRFRRLLQLILPCSLFSCTAFAQTWNSASGGSWGTAGNWSPSTVPNAVGATATLGTAITADRTINLMGNRTVGTLNVNSPHRYTLSGNTLRFDASSGTAKLNLTNSGGLRILSNVALQDNLVVTHNGTGVLTIEGVISGANDFTITGGGRVDFLGTSANTYSGTTSVNNGELRLGKTSGNAIAGPLVIGDGAGTDTVRLMGNEQIGNGASLTLKSSGELLFNGAYNEEIGSLDMTGGLVNTGSGTLTLNNNPAIVTHAHSNSAAIQGNLLLQGSKTIEVADGGASIDLDISADIGDKWYTTITKTGDGTMRLSGSNSFKGPMIISNGVVIAANDYALGQTGTWGNNVKNGAALHLVNNINISEGVINISGTGPDGNGALVSLSGDNSFTGNLTAADPALVSAASGASLTLNGDVTLSKDLTFSGAGDFIVTSGTSGAGVMTKTGSGTLLFSGTAGLGGKRLDVLEGDVYLNRPGVNLNTTEGPTVGTTSGPTAKLQLFTSNQIRNDLYVTVKESGTFDLNGNNEGVAGLKLYGGTVQSGAGTLSIVNAGGDEIHAYSSSQTSSITGSLKSDLAQGITITVDDGSPAVDLNISAAFSGSANKVTKAGGGVLQYSGTNANTYTGQTIVDAGILALNKTAGVDAIAGSSIKVNSGGTLRLDNDNQIKNSTSLILNGGTFLSGATTGHSETLNTLTLSSSSTIDLGTGSHQLIFADSSSISWTGTLIISNWAGVGGSSGTAGQIFFGVGGLTSTQLAQVQFEGHGPGSMLLPSGELVPIPEVKEIAAILAVLTVILLKERNRLRSSIQTLLRYAQTTIDQ